MRIHTDVCIHGQWAFMCTHNVCVKLSIKPSTGPADSSAAGCSKLDDI